MGSGAITLGDPMFRLHHMEWPEGEADTPAHEVPIGRTFAARPLGFYTRLSPDVWMYHRVNQPSSLVMSEAVFGLPGCLVPEGWLLRFAF